MIEALAEQSRRAILTMLCNGPESVTALADALPVSRPAVSQHLKVLKGVELVTDRAEGTRRIYSVRPESLEAVREYFDDFWQKSLMAFRLAAETDTPTRPNPPQPSETRESS